MFGIPSAAACLQPTGKPLVVSASQHCFDYGVASELAAATAPLALPQDLAVVEAKCDELQRGVAAQEASLLRSEEKINKLKKGVHHLFSTIGKWALQKLVCFSSSVETQSSMHL